MADSIATLGLRVDSTAALRQLDAFEKKTQNLGVSCKAAAASVAGIFASSKAAQFAQSWLQSAADAQESAGKFSAVFKHMTADAQKAADELVKSFNYSESQARDKLSTMADIFKKAGLSMSDALRYSVDLNKQAADLEAFTNCAGGLEQAINAVSKAMIGETEAAKTLGVVVLADAVTAKVAEEKRKGLTFATQQAALMHARYSIIMEQSASATGQIARESDNYSSRLRVLRARADDLKTALGEALIEPATRLVGVLASCAEKIASMDSTTRGFLVVGGLATATVGALGAAVTPLITAFASLTLAKKAASSESVKGAAAEAAEAAAKGASATASTAATAAINAEAAARARLAATLDVETAALTRNAEARAVGGVVSVPAASRSNATPKQRGGQTAANVASVASLLPVGAFGKLGSVFSRLFSSVSRLIAPFTKLLPSFGKFAKNVERVAPAAQKTAGPLSRVVAFLGRAVQPMARIMSIGGRLGPVGAAVAAVAAALTGAAAIFQDGGANFEVFLRETWPKIKTGAADAFDSIVQKIKGLPQAAANAWSGIVDWFGKGFLGLAQVAKRVAGFETEASRQYELNKKIEAANAARERLKAAEKASLEAETKILNAQAAVRREIASRTVARSSARADDYQKAGTARAEFEKTDADLKAKNNELNAAKAEVEKLNAEAKKAAETFAAAEKELIEAQASKNPNADKAKIQAANKRKEAAQKELSDVEAKRDAATANAEQLQIDIKGTAEKWEAQGKALDELTKTITESTVAFNESQRAFSRQREENEKAETASQLAQNLENAKSYNAQVTARAAIVENNKARVAEAEAAKSKATELNDQLVATRKRLDSQSANDALARLETFAKGTDKTSTDALGEYHAARNLLGSAGYNVWDEKFNDATNAADLFAKIVGDREKDRANIEKLTTRRDEAQSKADGLGAARAELEASKRDRDAARQERNDAIAEREDADATRRREAAKFERGLSTTARNHVFDTQFSRATNAEKMGLLSARGAIESAEYQTRLRASASKLAQYERAIAGYDKAENEGTLTEAQAKERDRLRNKRDALQQEHDDDRAGLLNSQIENENQRAQVAAALAAERAKPLKKRLLEQAEVEKDARGPINGQKAVSAGSSEAFQIASRVWDSGQRSREKTVENIEKFVERMEKNLALYLTRQAAPTTLQMDF